MTAANTARGPIDTAQLGVTLMHEHVFLLSPEIMQNYPESWGDEAQREADAVRRLNELKAGGVDTIVDLTVIGLGRYIPRIARVAAQTDVQIVVATGVYTYNDVPLYFYFTGPGTELNGPETMTDMFVRDIESGIADTGVKAAILKCATDEPGLTAGVERVLRAVAQAHRHSGDSTDLDYLEELIANGSYLGMDRFGYDDILPFAERIETVARMCERGHADKMVLSHDAACFIAWMPAPDQQESSGNSQYLHIHNDVLPALKKRGVTEDQIHTMLIDNPRRIFEHQGGY